MVELGISRRGEMAAPGFQIPVRAVTFLVPALLVGAARVGAEQHAARLESRAQLAQDPRQFLRRDVKQGSVGERAVKAVRREVEPEEILVQYFAAGMRARHLDETRRALQPDRDVAEVRERLEVPARPTA